MTTLTFEKLLSLQALLRACGLPGAVIAGGAPRDLFNNKPIKDIDVFVEEWPTPLAFGRVQDTLHSTLKMGEGHYPCHAVNFAEGFHMHPVQVIILEEDPLKYIKQQFDFGLCQIWMGPHGPLGTKAFWRDQLNHTVTYCLQGAKEWQLDHSRDHLKRLRVKYPDWRFERCWELADKVSP